MASPDIDLSAPPAPTSVGQGWSGSMPTDTPEEKAAKVARREGAVKTAQELPLQWAPVIEKDAQRQQKVANTYARDSEQTIADTDAARSAAYQPLADAQAKATADYQEAISKRQEYRAKVTTQIEDMDKYAKLIAAEQPHDIWAESSTPLKIAGILAMGLGGAAQALYGDRTNAVTDQIDAAVKRDLMLQRMRMEKDQQNYANKNLLLGKFIDSNEHMQNSEDKAYVTMMNGIMERAKVTGSLLTDPKMRLDNQKMVAELQMKAAATMQRVHENVAGEDIKMAEAEADRAAKAEQSSGSASAWLNANTRAETEKRHQDEQTAPNVIGQFRDRKAASDYRTAEAESATLIQGLGKLSNFLDKRDISSLQDKGQWNQTRAVLDLVAKGKDVYNLGSALTGLEAEKLSQAMGTGDWSYVFKNYGKARIQQAMQQIAQTVENRMKAEGVKPGASHPFLAGE